MVVQWPLLYIFKDYSYYIKLIYRRPSTTLDITTRVNYCSFLYIWIHLILLRLIDVPKFRAVIPREILIKINVHAAFMTSTKKPPGIWMLVAIYSSVIKVTTNFVHDILQQPHAWMTWVWTFMIFRVVRSLSMISWIWNLHISYFFALHQNI